jgi:hypothetical protein
MPNAINGKLIKVQSLQTKDEQQYITVKEGDIIEGFFLNWPIVGASFQMYKSDKRIKMRGGTSLTTTFPIPIITTEVQSIIDERTFKTKNSIYKIITLEDERDNKIPIIIE